MDKGISKTRLADSASLVAAFGASLCCIGPFVLIALGFGTLAGAVSAFFAPLRPYLLTVAFAIVGLRLFMLYRRENAAPVCATEEGATCPPDGRAREKALTWGVLGLVALFAASPYLLTALPSLPVANPPADVATAGAGADICLTIKGMTCSACAAHVEGALLEVPGVKTASVSFEDAEACLTVENPAAPLQNALIRAVASAGYQAERI